MSFIHGVVLLATVGAVLLVGAVVAYVGVTLGVIAAVVVSLLVVVGLVTFRKDEEE